VQGGAALLAVAVAQQAGVAVWAYLVKVQAERLLQSTGRAGAAVLAVQTDKMVLDMLLEQAALTAAVAVDITVVALV
jgi:diphthamide synthase (EF-2-diphthine--ammonia ligase)